MVRSGPGGLVVRSRRSPGAEVDIIIIITRVGSVKTAGLGESRVGWVDQLRPGGSCCHTPNTGTNTHHHSNHSRSIAGVILIRVMPDGKRRPPPGV